MYVVIQSEVYNRLYSPEYELELEILHLNSLIKKTLNLINLKEKKITLKSTAKEIASIILLLVYHEFIIIAFPIPFYKKPFGIRKFISEFLLIKISIVQ